MTKDLKITILVGGENSWFYIFAKKLYKKLKNKHRVVLVTKETDIQSGDLLLILSFPKIIPIKYLKKNNHNLVVHASKLPKGRGWSPLTWQILEGKNIIPISLFEANESVDSGKIYIQENLILEGNELIKEIRLKIGKKIILMILDFIKKYPLIKGKEQKGIPSYYKKRSLNQGKLNVNKSIKSQFNLLRTVDNKNYPAFFIYKDNKYILKIYKDKFKNAKRE